MDGTRERLVAAARQEFLEYGFRGASLRRIASAVGVTTGAIYGCFRDKAALLEAVVGEVYDAFMGNFLAAQDAFKAIPPEEQPDHVGMSSADYIHWAVGYMLEHRDEFRIILLGSEGTRFGRLIDEMVEIETAATNDFLSVLLGYSAFIYFFRSCFCHIRSPYSSAFSSCALASALAARLRVRFLGSSFLASLPAFFAV